nr:helix-turn-helix domain-containing protein [Tissierella pigra]
MDLIKTYCNTNDIESIEAPPKIIREDLADRYELTYGCYLEGLSLEEISQKRNFTKNTIIEHLAKSQEQGKAVDWLRFIDNPRKEEKILSVINQLGLEKLKPIKEALPEDITYEDIKIIIAKNELK